MSSLPILSPDYAAALWVNREREVQFVLSLFERLLDRQPVPQHIVVFEGEKGTGKSWLLRHLARQLAGHQPGRARTILPLIDLARFESGRTADALHIILDEVVQGLGQPIPPLPDIGLKARLCVDSISDRVSREPVVLLVDTVYEADESLAHQLDAALLTPFARLPGVLLIMTGRGQPVHWGDIILRATKTKFWPLDLFDDRATEEQLRKQWPPAPPRPSIPSAEVHQITRGNPGSNYVLGSFGLERRGEALDSVISSLLSVITDEDTRRRVRDSLEHLCVLKFGFMVDEVGVLLGVSEGQARVIFKELLRVGFVRCTEDDSDEPAHNESGYVIDETIRNLIEHYVQTEHPSLWLDMHSRARQLYADWQAQYSEEGRLYQSRVDYHTQFCPTPASRE